MITHLQVQSHYSLLEGVASVQELAAYAATAGFSHLALTDTGLYGAVSFIQACQKEQVTPLLGLTVQMEPPPEAIASVKAGVGRLVLLATNEVGWGNLCALTAVTGPLSWQMLKQHTEGLLCFETGSQGWLAHLLQHVGKPEATRYVSRLGALFQENVYLALDQPQNPALMHNLLAITQRFGMDGVAVHPTLCLQDEQLFRLRLHQAIAQHALLDNTPPPDPDVCWLTEAEMQTRYEAFPEALARISAIVAQCEDVADWLLNGENRFPQPLLADDDTSPEQVLAERVQEGVNGRYPTITPAIQDRLDKELTSINRHQFAPIFLIVADIVAYALANDIPVSTRGSVANSLVAYSLGITTVDPMAHTLLFERFLNPARANLPDIDLDFCSRRRDEVLRYVQTHYGAEHVALVGMINRFQAKSAVREVGKVYGLEEPQLKELSRLMPHHWHPDPRRRGKQELAQILAQITDETARDVVAVAFDLIGMPHLLSTHPGGLVITPQPVQTLLPVQSAHKGLWVTQMDHPQLERMGIPKLDLLGIRALTVLADTAEMVRQYHAPAFRVVNIPEADNKTGEMLQYADTVGVFQCESTGAQRTLRQLQARTLNDLAVANAFFKPGPALGGMAEAFVRRYRGEEAVTYLHPSLEPILQETKGVLLFQEQILRIATEVAGLTWGQADGLRRGMSKFKAREMAALRLKFIRGCQEPPHYFTVEEATQLWEQIIPFAGYGFNQGHALAYANVSYRSAYLKAHYPAEFLCARLQGDGGFHHPAIYMAEARRLGMVVRPPHINICGARFTLTYEADQPILWLGLGWVKGLRRQSIDRIVHEAPFDSLRDLLARVPLRQKEIAHLVQCGALDGLIVHRAHALAEVAGVARAGNALQMAFGFAGETAVSPPSTAQIYQWEQTVLGQPVSLTPLDMERLPEGVPLRAVRARPNERLTVVGYRLPGWTGGKGYYFTDGDDYMVVRGGKRGKVWQGVALNGRWQTDTWGNGWFQVL